METAGGAEGDGHRIIVVQVAGLAISDGQSRPPVLGDVVGYWLMFLSASERDEPEAELHWYTARAEPVPGTVRDGEPRSRGLWPTLLLGDGWAATWLAHHPVEGEVSVYGRLSISISYDSPVRVCGRITAVRGQWVDLDLDGVAPPT